METNLNPTDSSTRSPERGRSRESGTALLLALGFTAIVGTLLAGAATQATLQARFMRASTDSIQAQALAEGATEIAQQEMLTALANFQDPPMSGTTVIGGTTVQWTATQIAPTSTRTSVDNLQMICTPVEIDCQVLVGSGVANVSRVVDLTVTPVFQHMVFYDGTFHMDPGPSMTLEGRVHVNGDAYISGGTSVVFDTDYFHTTGEIIRSKIDGVAARSGTVTVKKYDDPTMVAFDAAEDSTSSNWVQTALSRWDGSVKSGAHGVQAVQTPSIGAMNPGGFYHQQAGLIIRDDEVVNSLGATIPVPPGVITETTIYDGREGKNVTVTNIDVGLLNASGLFPANGLIYAYRTDASVAQPNGFRLRNGSTLLGNLSVVSENSVYLQGDFNTVDKKAAAVISDAVNLLSNAWNDTKTAGTLPTASPTQYNLAMITGDVPSSSYYGGLENLPRFHERWTGVQATIRGSFTRLYESQLARGAWQQHGDVYSPPRRDFRFDPDLLDANNLPPFTPNAAYVRRMLWDDNREIVFKPNDVSLAAMPDAQVYDPWSDDAGFMSRVLSDPNANNTGSRYVNTSGTATGTPRNDLSPVAPVPVGP